MLAGTVGCAAALATLTVLVHRGGLAVDQAVLTWFVDQRRDWLTPLMVIITDVSGRRAVAFLAVVTAAGLWWRMRSVLPAVIVVAVCAGAGFVGVVLKHLVGMQRPPRELHLVVKDGPAFPSGHVSYTLALVGMTAVLLGWGARRAVIAAFAAVTALTAVAVSISRLYLGVHWLTDVVGGALLALSAIGVGTLGYRVLAGHRTAVAG